jgi:hypothetical protein
MSLLLKGMDGEKSRGCRGDWELPGGGRNRKDIKRRERERERERCS